ncbi:MAG: hypothetical protein EHM43_12510 [Ignavibacteriae bacterium]|nr:MAG: hypothetical protein EHM43_12510 [Ignavibacteriota bacterium]
MSLLLTLLLVLTLDAPTITMDDAIASPITDQIEGSFWVYRIRIEPKEVRGATVNEITDISAVLQRAMIIDKRSGNTYKAIIAEQPALGTDGMYGMKLKVTGGKYPLYRGQIYGTVATAITATATVDGPTTASTTKTKAFDFHN